MGKRIPQRPDPATGVAEHGGRVQFEGVEQTIQPGNGDLSEAIAWEVDRVAQAVPRTVGRQRPDALEFDEQGQKESSRGRRAVEEDDGPPGTALELDGRWLLNPGSVGQPRDGDPRAAWLELDFEGRTARFHRESYDIERTQAELRERELPEALAERLAHGV